jgi:hypothetical protein
MPSLAALHINTTRNQMTEVPLKIAVRSAEHYRRLRLKYGGGTANAGDQVHPIPIVIDKSAPNYAAVAYMPSGRQQRMPL